MKLPASVGLALLTALSIAQALHAQPATGMRRIAVLMPYADDATAEKRLALFRQGLEDRGWKDGQTARIDYYFSNSDMKRAGMYASKVVQTSPDVIFAASPPVVAALKRETSTIPIVFTNITDPVGVGLVESLSHPGGNITGFGAYEFAIAGKWVDVLRQIAPATEKIFVLKMPQHATNAKLFEAAKQVGASVKIDVTEANVRTPSDIEKEISAAAGVGRALMVLPSPATTDQHRLIIQLAVQNKLPAIFPYRDLAEGGGLVSYGPNVSEDYKSAASYVDRILKGEKPSELPVQAPAKFELIINMRTAKALGLPISQSLLAQADEVIE